LEELRGASSLEEVSRRIRGDPEAVKARLAALSLKIGGTETQRLERLFEVTALASSVKNTETWPKGVPAKLLAKGSRVAAADPARAERRAKAVARLERAVAALLFELRGTLDATKAQVEKKQTLSAAELEAENEEDSDFVASESDDDDARDDPVNNPLRLPLGFDGKPIPYWLYKLHGLNLEFTCEICGNYSYWGRRAYERHFKEPRHQHGMRCLKIPNTKAFAEVRNTFLARRAVIARFRERPRRARFFFFSRGASRRAALETFFFFFSPPRRKPALARRA
jgi:splicing factor 3A subunit 3